MSYVTVGRWGKNLALRFPNDLATDFGLQEGERVEIAAQDDTIVIRRLTPQLTLDELFAGKSPEAWRALYADAYDWGPEFGREIIEE